MFFAILWVGHWKRNSIQFPYNCGIIQIWSIQYNTILELSQSATIQYNTDPNVLFQYNSPCIGQPWCFPLNNSSIYVSDCVCKRPLPAKFRETYLELRRVCVVVSRQQATNTLVRFTAENLPPVSQFQKWNLTFPPWPKHKCLHLWQSSVTCCMLGWRQA